MQNSILRLVPCSNCHRLVQLRKLPIHELMCSTTSLRQSRLLYNEQPLSQPSPPSKKQKVPSSIQQNHSKIKKHTLVCEKRHRKITKTQRCHSCYQLFTKQQLEYHQQRQCKHRLVPCIDCDDMFPLSLFTEHLEVCRARERLNKIAMEEGMQEKQKGQECNRQSAMSGLIAGLGYVGAALYNKGFQAVGFCQKIVQKAKGPTLLYLQQIRTKIQDAFEDLFEMAYEQNVQGMPRDLIRKIPNTTFTKPPPSSQQKDEQLCTICYCEIEDKEVVKVLLCKHLYHPICIEKWLKINRTCPLCKRDQVQLMMEQERENEEHRRSLPLHFDGTYVDYEWDMGEVDLNGRDWM